MTIHREAVTSGAGLGAGLGVGLGAGKLRKSPTDYQRVMCQVWDVRVDVFLYK